MLLSAIALASACHPTGDKIAMQGAEDFVRRRVVPSPPGAELMPALPDSIHVGESLWVEARPRLGSGEPCRWCRVRWSEIADGPARWQTPDPPCGLGRCAVLEGAFEGSAELWLEVCPGEVGECGRYDVRIEVLP